MTATNTTTAKTTAAKTPNYSPEQEKTLETGYKAGREAKQDNKTIVASLAAATGKNTRSIVAKLNRMGLYAKDAYVSKTGEKPVKKDGLADAIGAVLKMNEAETTSLTNCSKDALKKIFAALAMSKPIDGTEPQVTGFSASEQEPADETGEPQDGDDDAGEPDDTDNENDDKGENE
jgi:hypothetical protein